MSEAATGIIQLGRSIEQGNDLPPLPTYGCGAYASMISSLIFGDQTNPCRKVEDLDSYGEGRSHHLEGWTRYPEGIPYTGNSVGAWPTGMTEKKIRT